jgi:hypothetical protein
LIPAANANGAAANSLLALMVIPVKMLRKQNQIMFSHIVVFWTDPAKPNAVEELIAGANKYLKSLPGVLQFHVGRMSPSPRPVVEQSYQVAMNMTFPSKAAEQAYQVHPQHLEFVEKAFKPNCTKVVIYDFE